MAYETATPFLPHYPPPPRRVRMSRWWPVSFLILALVLLIIGGALIGASAYNAEYFDDNYGEFYGGVVLLVLGGICKLIGWVLLVICLATPMCRCTRRPPAAISELADCHEWAGNDEAILIPCGTPGPGVPLYYQDRRGSLCTFMA
ncbi:hypothetical protein ACCO45_007540 [Purpureocillium lilacinum]|uniref:Uncharacterized protein n=1 Tax=Purpureocillium lilacinum TaxID=33203 RepID=A0ACC4DVP6_PURLI